jgi:putative ABC transport system substrate-binding protein
MNRRSLTGLAAPCGADALVQKGSCVRALLASVASVTFAISTVAPIVAQSPPKVRVGFLTVGGTASPARDAFWQGLREHGWAEGDNLIAERRQAEGKPERLLDLADELVRLRVDVIVAAGNTATAAAQKATSVVPIVFTVSDAVGSGFVASLARPGGNLTGFDVLSRELSVKRLELLREGFPRAGRVAVLYQSDIATHQVFLQTLEAVASTRSVQLRPVDVRSANDIDRAAEIIARERINALFPLASPFFSSESRRLVNLAAKVRLPATYEHREYVDIGGLMSYGPNFHDVYRRAAIYVDKILRGAKPGDLPVEQPTKFELVINLKTAKALGLTIPPSLLARADQVIE